MRPTRSLTAPDSCSCKPEPTRPLLIAAIVFRWSRCASAAARQESPTARAAVTASVRAASVCARERGRVGGGAACSFPPPPHALRQRTAAQAATLLLWVFRRSKTSSLAALEPGREDRRQPALAHLDLCLLDRIWDPMESGKPPLEIRSEERRVGKEGGV